MAELGSTTVYGNLYVSNDIHGQYFYGIAMKAQLADIQENLYTDEKNIIPGDIVQLKDGKITKKINPYSKRLYVVSSQPQYLMGIYRKNSVPIQIKGSVYIKTNVNLNIGDKIVQSKNGLQKKKSILDIFKRVLGEIIQIEDKKYVMWIY